MLAMRWPMRMMRATFSARSMYRASQNRLSAVRLSMASALQDPGVLRAAALARIDHQAALAQRDAGQAAGDDADLLAKEDEGPEIDVPRRDPGLDEGRAGRERQRRL